MSDELKALLGFGLFILLIVAMVLGASALGAKSYEDTTYDNCKQYSIIPEKYINKVPDGCLPTYFKDKPNV